MVLFLAAVPFVASAAIGIGSSLKKKKKKTSKPKPKPKVVPIAKPKPAAKPVSKVRPSAGNKGPSSIAGLYKPQKKIAIEEDEYNDPDGMPLSPAVGTVDKTEPTSHVVKPSLVAVAKLGASEEQATFTNPIQQELTRLFKLEPCDVDGDAETPDKMCMDPHGATFVGMASGLLVGLTVSAVFDTPPIQSALIGLLPGGIAGKVLLADIGLPASDKFK